MTIIPTFLHRKSLTVSIIALPTSLAMTFASFPFVHALPPFAEYSYWRSGVFSGLALLLCGAAWINLIKDVERNYSPTRCSYAAMLLLAATVWPVLGLLFALRVFNP